MGKMRFGKGSSSAPEKNSVIPMLPKEKMEQRMADNRARDYAVEVRHRLELQIKQIRMVLDILEVDADSTRDEVRILKSAQNALSMKLNACIEDEQDIESDVKIFDDKVDELNMKMNHLEQNIQSMKNNMDVILDTEPNGGAVVHQIVREKMSVKDKTVFGLIILITFIANIAVSVALK